jgi:hypothetical protein
VFAACRHPHYSVASFICQTRNLALTSQEAESCPQATERRLSVVVSFPLNPKHKECTTKAGQDGSCIDNCPKDSSSLSIKSSAFSRYLRPPNGPRISCVFPSTLSWEVCNNVSPP